jgi:hypothetical protein
MAVKVIRSDDYLDVSIVNKRYLTAPLRSLTTALDVAGLSRYPWCPRCRRPTYYGAFTEKHHALRLQPALTTDEPFRCYYCGIRKEMAKGYGL